MEQTTKDVEKLEVNSESSSEVSDPLDMRGDEGWEDVEPDVETVSFKSFFSDKRFTNLKSMLEYDQQNFGFDFIKLKNDLDLDFLESIKLVNYARSEAANGNQKLSLSSKETFADEKYLQPVLEDDAVLFSLDDLDDDQDGAVDQTDSQSPEARIRELEMQLKEAQATVDAVREMSQRVIDGRSAVEPKKPSREEANDSTYFQSYAYIDIHETMLKDTSRTDAYRDFIYDNKHLFKDKVVLDVGCGTGILSMMSAKAGAKAVYAVDNSKIIEKARENIFANKLDHVITCIHGKVEDIALPVSQVDIIVSEWMGYALLFEAMLDSVLNARDRFLKPDTGLMVPSSARLRIAPLADSTLISEKIAFWGDVYGFDMRAMREGICTDVVVLDAQRSTVPAEVEKESPSGMDFLTLDLYKTTVEDLIFTSLPFNVKLSEDIDALDGFVLWFDVDFDTSRIPGKSEGKDITLSTGPHAPHTHWMQCLLLIDRMQRGGELGKGLPLCRGKTVKGTIGYERPESNSRLLAIKVRWEVEPGIIVDGQDKQEKGEQVWKLE